MTKHQRKYFTYMFVFAVFFITDKQYGFSGIWAVIDSMLMIGASWMFAFGKDPDADSSK